MIDVSTLKVGDVLVPIEEIGLDSYQKINNAAPRGIMVSNDI